MAAARALAPKADVAPVQLPQPECCCRTATDGGDLCWCWDADPAERARRDGIRSCGSAYRTLRECNPAGALPEFRRCVRRWETAEEIRTLLASTCGGRMPPLVAEL